MKLKDLKIEEADIYRDKVVYANNRISEIAHEIELHEGKIAELKLEINTLQNTEIKKIQLPYIADAIWIGKQRIR